MLHGLAAELPRDRLGDREGAALDDQIEIRSGVHAVQEHVPDEAADRGHGVSERVSARARDGEDLPDPSGQPVELALEGQGQSGGCARLSENDPLRSATITDQEEGMSRVEPPANRHLGRVGPLDGRVPEHRPEGRSVEAERERAAKSLPRYRSPFGPQAGRDEAGSLPVRRPAVDPGELARWETDPAPWRERAGAAARYLP